LILDDIKLNVKSLKQLKMNDFDIVWANIR